MTDPGEIVDQLERRGYAVLADRLDGNVLAAARAELGALLDQAGWGSGFDGSRTRRFWALLARTRCLDQAALDPLVLEIADRLIGPGSQFGLTYSSRVHPGQEAQRLHYEQGIYPLPRDRDVMLTAIWALDDFTAANGATRVVPDSHSPACSMPGPDEAVPVEMAAGSVLLFSGRLWHGAGANVSTGPRLGAAIDYVQPWLRPCEAHALCVSLDQARALPRRLQELLGFNQPSPYLGFIGGQHPRDWLLEDVRQDRPPAR
jgi:ectoine hydroxylase-related dioxygenase (phytanoyl-CoA dioxygenase family)